MTADHSWIGYWAWRWGGKAHLVESEVTDRLVMRCGRQMRLVIKSGGELHFEAFEIIGNFGLASICEQCAP